MLDTGLNLIIGQGIRSLWVGQHFIPIVFVFAFGAIVGSFINVVIYRLPAGMSVISPPSRCPVCGARLAWWENFPIVGWFILRAKCRRCKAKISPQYMLIELLMALIFVLLYVVLYTQHPDKTGWLGRIGGDWWYYNGFGKSWPTFVAILFLVAALVAMTVIDARTYTIPIEIPLFVIVTAFILFPVQSLLAQHPRAVHAHWGAWPIPTVSWQVTLACAGAMVGVLFSVVLLYAGKLKHSFHDYEEYVKEGETLAEYPHARREMFVELKFLLPCFVLFAVGWWIGSMQSGQPSRFVMAIGSTVAGYLSGAAIVWAIRILGTLGFGREAMGMGDVHLLGAVGAVLGWIDPIAVFFIAPFSGLLLVALGLVLGTVIKGLKGFSRELPYGPHLAVATVVVVLCRPGLESLWNRYVLPPPPAAAPGGPAAPAVNPGNPSPNP